jgi:hypothetical protein
MAQEVKLVDPVLRHVMTVHADYGPPQLVGPMGRGTRRIHPVLGGTFELHAVAGGTFDCPALTGTVEGGGDWQTLHGEALSILDARITLKTSTGHYIYVQAAGRRYAPPDVLKRLLNGEPVQRKEYYGVSSTVMETSAPELEWMNYHQFLGNARTEKTVHHIRYFAVDYNP